MNMMKNIRTSNSIQMASYLQKKKKTVEIPSMIIVVTAVFRAQNNKYYPQFF